MLTLLIYSDSSQTTLLADFSSRCQLGEGRGFSFTTDTHGFGSLSVPLIPMALYEAFECYLWPGTPYALVRDVSMGIVWEGRVEDITIIEGGISLTAFGYQRALYDVPYTGFFSKSGSANWKQVTNSSVAVSETQKWVSDNNNRIYIALRQGETYDYLDSIDWAVAAPDGGDSNIKSISMSYNITLPTNFRVSAMFFDILGGAAFGTTILDGNGSNQTGTYSYTYSGTSRYFGIRIQNNSGSAYNMTAQTGDYYARFTSLRIKSIAYGTTVVASDIVKALIAFVSGINADQLSDSTALVTATTTDLYDEIYEDEYPAEILNRLALLHNNEWGVYENQMLHFRPIGGTVAGQGQTWYVDIDDIVEIQRSLENVYNSAYGVYRDANGDTQRTAVEDDDAAQERYDIVRRRRIDVQTTSETQAETHRDLFLEDQAETATRMRVRFSRLYNTSGGEMPLYHLRAGDTLTIRNFPTNIDESVADLRTFTVDETNYDAMEDTISVSPRYATPQLDRLIARKEAGIR